MMKKILIVEDDSFLSDIYKNQLQQEGFETEVVTDGRAALVCLERTAFDLILLDMIMPGMNGFDFLEVMRQDNRFNQTPIMILTNLGQEEDKRRCQEIKECSYFVKTEVTIDEMIKKIKEKLGV